jgi:hypothetical protein
MPEFGDKREDDELEHAADFAKDDEEREHRNDPPQHGAFVVTTDEIGEAIRKIEGKP